MALEENNNSKIENNSIKKLFSTIKSSSEEINKAIKLIKNKSNEKDYEKLKQLIETVKLYEEYEKNILKQHEKIISKSQKNLKILFNSVSLNIDKLPLLNSEIKKFMNIVRNKVNSIIILKDNNTEDNNTEDNNTDNKISKLTSTNQKQLEEKKEIKNTKKLFEKYFGNKEVLNRGDINSIELTQKLYNAIDRGEIDQSEKQQILQYGYYLAFKAEIKTKEGKKGINNIRKYEKQWKNIFYNELKGIIKSKETAQNLFLLSWIEGNGKDQPKNYFGASGWFQILLSTAKNVIPGTTEKDLHNSIKSAKIAAKYIKKLIINEKKENSDLDENNIIKNAITKYNGNFSSRLLEGKRKNISNTIYELFKDLNWVRNQINNYKNISEIKQKLLEIHNKYYIHTGNGNGNFKGKSHFSILEKKSISKQNVDNWISNYIRTILKQQDMYPIQFNAINKLYKKRS